MAKRIPVPADLEHLLEKRETPERRTAERRKKAAAKPAPLAADRRGVQGKRKVARRKTT